MSGVSPHRAMIAMEVVIDTIEMSTRWRGLHGAKQIPCAKRNIRFPRYRKETAVPNRSLSAASLSSIPYSFLTFF